MAKITDIRWSEAYNGSLAVKVDGREAFIPIEKRSVVDEGYIPVFFRKYADEKLRLLPSVERGGLILFDNAIVGSEQIARYWKACYRALNDGSFIPGKLVDAGPIEV